jgi:hypothetical protein
VAAPADADANGNTVKFPVWDARTLPGENAGFPWVSPHL